jgi:hypothetical protein
MAAFARAALLLLESDVDLPGSGPRVVGFGA